MCQLISGIKLPVFVADAVAFQKRFICNYDISISITKMYGNVICTGSEQNSIGFDCIAFHRNQIQ